jgi:predicted dehydrogenase
VGAGNISRVHFDSMDELGDAVDVVGVADPVEEARLKAADRFDCPTFQDSKHMFDNVEPEAVFVLIPPFARGETEIEAAKRGLHIFVEKPVALNMETANEISAAIDATDVVSSVGYQLRYSNLTRQAEQFTSSAATAMASGFWASVFPQLDWWGGSSEVGRTNGRAGNTRV